MTKFTSKKIPTALELQKEADNALSKELVFDVPAGLSNRQKRIYSFRTRGMTVGAISKVENVSESVIYAELRAIRDMFSEQGRNIDQDFILGETQNLYQEIEAKGWELYTKAVDAGKLGDANRALATIMTARDNSIKLLMNLGLVKRVQNNFDQVEEVPSFLKKFQETTVSIALLAEEAINKNMPALEAPRPPEDIDFTMVEDDDEDPK